MRGGRFRIMEAAIQGYRFAGREAGYLFRVALAPFALTLLTSFYIQFAQKDAGEIAQFLWGLPASVALGWYLFIETRLVLLGERIDLLARQDLQAPPRQSAMHATVIISLLFDMALTGFAAFALWAVQNNPEGGSAWITVALMFMIGLMFWGLRFLAAPILAACGQSIRKFIFIVNGVEFSLRILGLGALCFLPVMFAGNLIAGMLVRDYPFMKEPSTLEIYTLIVVNATGGIIAATVLNAAAAYAVREILMREEGRKRS